jgi:hypothetical protein
MLLPGVVKTLKSEFPNAKTFGATRRYFAAGHTELERQQRAEERRNREVQEQVTDNEHAAAERRRDAELDRLWQALPTGEQETIRQAVLATQPASLQKFPGLLHNLCLHEYARRLKENTAA